MAKTTSRSLGIDRTERQTRSIVLMPKGSRYATATERTTSATLPRLKFLDDKPGEAPPRVKKKRRKGG